MIFCPSGFLHSAGSGTATAQKKLFVETNAKMSVLNRGVRPVLSMVLLYLATCSSALLAAEPVVSSLQLGFAGRGRVGSWLPVELTAAGFAAGQTVTLQISALDPRGNLCESVVAMSSADAAGTLQLTGVFAVGRLDGRMQVRLLNEQSEPLWVQDVSCSEDPTAEALPAYDTQFYASAAVASSLQLLRHQPATLLLTRPLAGIAALQERLRDNEATRTSLSVLSCNGSSGLPSAVRALGSVDHILITDEFDLNAAQAAALQTWVLQGGHLIISCGRSAPNLLSSPLGQWLQPVFEIPSETPVVTTLDLSPIQNFVLGATALQTNRNPVAVMQIPSRQPRVLAQSLTAPLISGASMGSGVITMVAVDLNSRPLDTWLSLPQLLEALIFSKPLSADAGGSSANSRISSLGVTDLSTQLLAAADSDPLEERWSSWDVMLIMLVVLLIIGPLDYLLVVRTLQKPRLTWLTFPLAITLICTLILQASTFDDAAGYVNRVGLLDISTGGDQQQLRARTWSSLTVADSQYGSISAATPDWLRQAPTSSHTVLSWSGRAEDVYGGMYRPGGAGLGQQISRRSETDAGEFSAMPLMAAGAAGFQIETTAAAAAGTWFESRLKLASSDLLEGTLVHHLPFPLQDWIVVCGNRVYTCSDRADAADRTLAPGEVWSRHNDNIRVFEIRSFLQGVRLVADSNKPKDLLRSNSTQISREYDIRGRDAFDILLMTSLYDSVGGSNFVRLQNDVLRKDEVSRMINLNGALLIGRADTALTDLQLNSSSQTQKSSQTVVRFFLPVHRDLIDQSRPAMRPDQQED